MIVHTMKQQISSAKRGAMQRSLTEPRHKKAAFLPIQTRNLYLSRVGDVTPGRGTECEQFFARTLARITLNANAETIFFKTTQHSKQFHTLQTQVQKAAQATQFGTAEESEQLMGDMMREPYPVAR